MTQWNLETLSDEDIRNLCVNKHLSLFNSLNRRDEQWTTPNQRPQRICQLYTDILFSEFVLIKEQDVLICLMILFNFSWSLLNLSRGDGYFGYSLITYITANLTALARNTCISRLSNRQSWNFCKIFSFTLSPKEYNAVFPRKILNSGVRMFSFALRNAIFEKASLLFVCRECKG